MSKKRYHSKNNKKYTFFTRFFFGGYNQFEYQNLIVAHFQRVINFFSLSLRSKRKPQVVRIGVNDWAKNWNLLTAVQLTSIVKSS